MYYTDLGDFSYKTGSETGHLVIAGMSNSFSLYNALMELCKEKKWLFSNRPQAWNIYRPNSPKALNGTHRKDPLQQASVFHQSLQEHGRKVNGWINGKGTRRRETCSLVRPSPEFLTVFNPYRRLSCRQAGYSSSTTQSSSDPHRPAPE